LRKGLLEAENQRLKRKLALARGDVKELPKCTDVEMDGVMVVGSSL